MLPEQNLPWRRHDRPWGFRFSAMDAAIQIAGGMSALASWLFVGPFALVVPLLLGPFLLFCNVFRVGAERSFFLVETLAGRKLDDFDEQGDAQGRRAAAWDLAGELARGDSEKTGPLFCAASKLAG